MIAASHLGAKLSKQSWWEIYWSNEKNDFVPDLLLICTNTSWHVHCMWPRESLTRVIDQSQLRCISWEAAKRSQQFPFPSCVDSFLSEQKSQAHAFLNLYLSLGNINDKLFFNIFLLTAKTTWKWCEDAACRQKWMALTKECHHHLASSLDLMHLFKITNVFNAQWV